VIKVFFIPANTAADKKELEKKIAAVDEKVDVVKLETEEKIEMVDEKVDVVKADLAESVVEIKTFIETRQDFS
jgi:hypothetical protein